jgi:hypothetical protein
MPEHPFFRKILPVVLAIASAMYLAFTLYKDFPLWKSNYITPPNPIFLVSAILLMPLNWWIESVKWHFLAKSMPGYKKINLAPAILAGVATAVASPNRIGEIAGRLLYIPAKLRWPYGIASILGSYAQLCITLGLGLIATWIQIHHAWFPEINFPLPLLILSLLILSLYLSSGFWLSIGIPPQWKKKWKTLAHLPKSATPTKLAIAAAWAASRYFVFSLQAWLILFAFGIYIPFLQGFSLIALHFFASTIIPSIGMSELGTRNATALILFAPFAPLHNTSLIIIATTLLWTINIATPALGGIAFLFFYNKQHKT